MSDKRGTHSGNSALCLLYSFLIMSAAFILISLVFSIAAYCTDDPLSWIKPMSVASIILSATAGSFLVARLYGASRSALSALIAALIMLAVGIISKKGAVDTGAFINICCYMATSALVAYLARRKSGSHSKRRKRR